MSHTLGILAHKDTNEVPGTVVLLSSTEQEPLGLNQIQRKRTADGIILSPQPDDHPDDPLNWPSWRRDCALLALGWHCLVGGGMTPVLAAGFKNVAQDFDVSIPDVALTTGLYMLGLGIGAVVVSPTALIYGKRPVYLAGIVLFLVSSCWAAASPNYGSLVAARIFMGIGVSPCEALPSATIAEIFFLHERAYRIGVYTLLLLGGKNIVPLVSAAIIQTMGWRWVFWIVAIIVSANLFLTFLFVPETFWDRTPQPNLKSAEPSMIQRAASIFTHARSSRPGSRTGRSRRNSIDHPQHPGGIDQISSGHLGERSPSVAREGRDIQRRIQLSDNTPQRTPMEEKQVHFPSSQSQISPNGSRPTSMGPPMGEKRVQSAEGTPLPSPLEKEHLELPTTREMYQMSHEKTSRTTLDQYVRNAAQEPLPIKHKDPENAIPSSTSSPDADKPMTGKTFVEQLKVYNGPLHRISWWRAAVRPLILFAYPAVLWSTFVYSLSIGWLIVLSETVASIYQANPYNFSRLATGLVYLSPFIGGIIGTAVAGKISDFIVKAMSRRNGGVYEPEFRLVMGLPVAICTALGMMGFGWSAAEHDAWIVPTVFFGIISFGCSLGSTTAITFCVDSYRQYAGEALVTLNFSKNVFHGFVFSLFFNHWLEAKGSKEVFLVLGGIQMGVLLFTIPLYIYGKRLRQWTTEKKMMDRWST